MNYDLIADIVGKIKLEYLRTGAWHEQSCIELIDLTRKIPLFVCFQRGIPQDEIEDLVQSAFQEGFNRLASLTDHRSFPRYLYIIALNLCRQYWKKRCRTGNAISIDEYIPIEANADGADLIESRQIDREDLRDAIDRLADGYRDVICLYYFGGFSSTEIATMTHSCVNTVTSKLGRARRMLRRLMEEKK